jgi:multimeric flavodoxin WrbA
MKILALLGSPQKKGNTAQVLEWILDELEDMGHKTETAFLEKYDIKGCKGCYKCQRNPDEPACVQKDDAEKVFKKMIKADAIIWATPLYCWTFTAQMKAVIDRSLCLVSGYMTDKHKTLVQDKPYGLLVTSLGPIENNLDLVPINMRRIANWHRTSVDAELLVPFCVDPDKIAPEYREHAKAFANRLLLEVKD